MENVIYPWAQSDPEAAGAWLNRLPQGPDRDAALNAGVARVINSRPDLAAQWAAAIGDEMQQRRRIVQAVRAWMSRDADAARQWIANLPASSRSRLAECAERDGTWPP